MAAAAAVEIHSGEEILKERVRQNLKHLEEIGISRDIVEFARREYKLWADDPKQRYYRTSSTNANAAREYTGRIASGDQKIAALKRAEELQRDLTSHHPSFIKPMVRSHVSGGFWLGLPTKFCKENFSPNELRVILEDEKGKEHDVLYLGRKNGLSGGWRGFAIDHNLEDGDVLVFELSEPARFKVHIIKAIEGESPETDKTADCAAAVSKPKGSSGTKKDIQAASKKRSLKTGSAKEVLKVTKRGRR